ncbi:MAG: glycosyltransferase family 1 protein [Proteobacteria bacterium]|nr:glycosyltransferase family 1 protein [Pseudomonadota bacterium]
MRARTGCTGLDTARIVQSGDDAAVTDVRRVVVIAAPGQRACHRLVARRRDHAAVLADVVAPGIAISFDDPPSRPRPSLPALDVAVVTETYPPDVNGVAVTAARAVDGLRARGHRLQLVRPRRAGDATGPDDLLVPGLPLPGQQGVQMGLPAMRTLLRQWTLQRPDLVHLVTEGPLGWSALRAAERLGLPVVSDFRTNFHAYSGHYRIGWLRRPIGAYLRQFHNRTRCTMVPTRAMQQELEGLGVRRLEVVARGVDTQRHAPAHRSEALRRSWGAGAETRVLLCVARLAPEKNITLAYEAFRRCADEGHDVRLVLVGNGPSRRQLEARCPGVVFAGLRRGAELSAHYASADLFVFPSLTETWGNVVPEAMASGLPVLAYDCAAAGELVWRGVHGRLAAPHDEAAFLRHASALVADPAALRSMGASARDAARHLDWERVIDRLEAVLQEAAHSVAIDQAAWRSQTA